jgi:enterochelin esterase family protein
MVQHKENWISPRIQALREETIQGNNSALEAFWQEVEKRGTPLYEPIESEQDHCLVTFVWRGDGQTHNVVLVGSLASYMDGFLFADRQMDHLQETDLWYRTYRVRNDIHTTYQFSPNDPLVEPKEVNDWLERFVNFCPDPLNPLQIFSPKDEEIADSYNGSSSVVQGYAQSQVEPAMVESMRRGLLAQHRLHSEILQNDRRIWVYTPPEYDPLRAQPYGLLLFFDGFDYVHAISPPTMLDTLLSAQQIPPLIIIYVDNLGQQVRNRELPCYQPFVEFLVQELMPWVHHRYHVTRDPQQTIVSGSSYGGLAAAFAGLRASNVFGNVLAQSGSFWWKPENENEYEWIIRQFEQVPRLPIRFFLTIGLWEPAEQRRSVRHLHHILQAKEYRVLYHEYYGGHDDLAWHDVSPLALRQLVNDW